MPKGWILGAMLGPKPAKIDTKNDVKIDAEKYRKMIPKSLAQGVLARACAEVSEHAFFHFLSCFNLLNHHCRAPGVGLRSPTSILQTVNP